MTSTAPKPAEKIQKLLMQHVLSAPNTELTNAMETEADDPIPAICKALGWPTMTASKLDDLPEAEQSSFLANMQNHILVKKISEGIGSKISLALSTEEINSIGEEKAPCVKIETSKTPELILTETYAKYSERIQLFIDTQPGLIESIQAEHGVQSLHIFSDESLISQTIIPSDANFHIRAKIIGHARSLADLIAAEELATLHEAYAEGFRKLEAPLNANSTGALSAEILELIEQEVMTILTSAKAPAKDMTSIFANGDGFAENFKANVEGTSWKEGFSIKVNGKECSTPSDFHSELHSAGIPTSSVIGSKPLGIEGALARLRAAKQAGGQGLAAGPKA